jgi:queuine tRNA-ribosyltransferase
MGIQQNLGSDIAMVIDECPPWPCERDDCAKAVARSCAGRGSANRSPPTAGFSRGHHVFAIVQGSTFDDLRREAAESLAALDFPGYAVGGVSVGEPEPEMLKQVAATTPFLPADKPRYTMGLGTPPQLLKMVALGWTCSTACCRAAWRATASSSRPTDRSTSATRSTAPTRSRFVEGLDNYTAEFLPGLPAPPRRWPARS